MTAWLERPAAAVARVRRFVTVAAGELRWEAGRAFREALRFNLARRLAKTLQRAWITSDPDWIERLTMVGESPEEEARRAAARQERALARARLAVDGPVVYAGELRARVANRGVVLADHPRRPGVRHWLCDELGLDGYYGDSVSARLSVELINSEPGDSANTPSALRPPPTD